MVGLGPTIHEFSMGNETPVARNSWMVVPSTTMTYEKNAGGA
jgi:hypothetical protein